MIFLLRNFLLKKYTATENIEVIGKLIRSGFRLRVEKLFSNIRSNKKTLIAGAKLLEDISISEGVTRKTKDINNISTLSLLGNNLENK